MTAIIVIGMWAYLAILATTFLLAWRGHERAAAVISGIFIAINVGALLWLMVMGTLDVIGIIDFFKED